MFLHLLGFLRGPAGTRPTCPANVASATLVGGLVGFVCLKISRIILWIKMTCCRWSRYCMPVWVLVSAVELLVGTESRCVWSLNASVIFSRTTSKQQIFLQRTFLLWSGTCWLQYLVIWIKFGWLHKLQLKSEIAVGAVMVAWHLIQSSVDRAPCTISHGWREPRRCNSGATCDQKHNLTQAAGASTLQKCLWDEVLLEDFCCHEEDLEYFNMMECHNADRNTAVLGLQTKVQRMEYQLKVVLVKQTFKDICHLGSSLAVLTKQSGIWGTRYDTKNCNESCRVSVHSCQGVETNVEVVNIASQIGVQCNAAIKGWIAIYGVDLGAIIKNYINVVSSKLFPRLLPIGNFFASVGPFRISKSLSMALQMPIIGEGVLA